MDHDSQNQDSQRQLANNRDSGSVVDGFLIGLALIILSSLVSWLILSAIAPGNTGPATDSSRLVLFATLSFPFIVIFSSIIWFGWKQKVKIAYGIVASVALAVISLPILLVAACFGMFN
jgi:hypothetical protein